MARNKWSSSCKWQRRHPFISKIMITPSTAVHPKLVNRFISKLGLIAASIAYAKNKNRVGGISTIQEVNYNAVMYYTDLKGRNMPTQSLTQDSLKLIISEEQLDIVPDPKYTAVWMTCILEKLRKNLMVDDKETTDLSQANLNQEKNLRSGTDPMSRGSPRGLRVPKGRSKTYNLSTISPVDSQTEQLKLRNHNSGEEDSSISRKGLILVKFDTRSRSTTKRRSSITTSNELIHSNNASRLYKITTWKMQDSQLESPLRLGKHDGLSVKRSADASIIRNTIRQVDSDGSTRHKKLLIVHKNSAPPEFSPSRSPEFSNTKGRRIKFDDNVPFKQAFMADQPTEEGIQKISGKSPKNGDRPLFVKLFKKQGIKS